MCKQNKLQGLIPVTRKNECWQPESSEVGYIWILIFEFVQSVRRYTWNRWKYTLKKYTGKQNVTSLGFECENWDDERYQSHRYKPLRANHNFCRDPSGLNGKPWCYVKSKQKWDYCPIDFCYDHDGSRLEFNFVWYQIQNIKMLGGFLGLKTTLDIWTYQVKAQTKTSFIHSYLINSIAVKTNAWIMIMQLDLNW